MTDYLIVGGGLIGLLTARCLNHEGAQVTVVERGKLGRESSWAGGGILSPLYPWKYPDPVNALASWSQPRHQQLAEELERDTGIDVEWVQSGLVILDEDQHAAANAWTKQFSSNLLSLDEHSLHDIEPALGAGRHSGLWMPDVAQIRNPRLMQALHQDLLARGVRIAEDTEVTHLLTRKGRIQGVRTEYSEINAQRVVIASGAWSATLLKDLGHQLPVTPVRGQMVLFRGQPDQLQRIVLSRGHYAIPRRDGRVLVGSTMEEVGFDKTITDDARKALVDAAVELVPFLADVPVERHWAGLRPGSPTGVPFIGAYPGLEGLFINAGHFRNGVVMAPASAQLLVDIMLERPAQVDESPYALLGRSDAA
ncbi:MAG: glycine oxidase ThiO [Gammaproteobacteria bacterium]|nr:glycine oxidase ThiO [Gammaproteobacteria bacterium]